MSDTPAETSDRAERADKIISNAANYKVCEGCESIVATRAATCPSCSAYRFDSDPDTVREHARLLASRERKTVVDEDFL